MVTVEAEPGTFTGVLRANQAMVLSIAYHFLRDRSSAEEIAQDAFLQLYRSFGELEGEAHTRFWLRKVTSRLCIDFVRKNRRRELVALEDAPEPEAAEERGDPLLNRQLRLLIASLPEKPRIVMVLRYQEDLMPEEIARILEMPVRTVKSHLQRSLALLREKIGRSLGDIR
jgi:RNA polymerase sigma-70 factor (ECF subfamily)